jgi:NTP pyrophosphatase (non-canonical NTP hydrolase)
MKNLKEYIINLSLNDKKTLTQKVAKLFEEGGELAKAILPYEGAYATNHRIINKKKILEELVDVHLVNQSIIHSLGFTDNEFKDMLLLKSEKWNKLQIKEDRSLKNSDLMPYEIHITVNYNSNEKKISIDKFKIDCKEIGVKPILLDLQDKKGNSVMDDLMTSSKIYGSNKDVFDEMERISKKLSNKGYNIIRQKIEASYWHPNAPFRIDGDVNMPNGCYFECHLNVLCYDDDQEHENILSKLSNIAKNNDCHLSKNAFKKFDNGSFTIMLTFRSYDMMYEDFEAKIIEIKNQLTYSKFPIEKEIVEFSIFDTKNNHDDLWINSNN